MLMFEGKDEDLDVVWLLIVYVLKGFEYLYVFLVGVEEGIMLYCGGSEDDGLIDNEWIEEECWLMYVVIICV